MSTTDNSESASSTHGQESTMKPIWSYHGTETAISIHTGPDSFSAETDQSGLKSLYEKLLTNLEHMNTNESLTFYMTKLPTRATNITDGLEETYRLWRIRKRYHPSWGHKRNGCSGLESVHELARSERLENPPDRCVSKDQTGQSLPRIQSYITSFPIEDKITPSPTGRPTIRKYYADLDTGPLIKSSIVTAAFAIRDGLCDECCPPLQEHSFHRIYCSEFICCGASTRSACRAKSVPLPINDVEPSTPANDATTNNDDRYCCPGKRYNFCHDRPPESHWYGKLWGE